MYQSYFGLAEAPFSIAPDPRYLYMSQRHQEALAHLLYGVSGEGGFVLLTGEIGAGKTTVCRCLLEQIPESCDVAYIFNPKLTVEELLSTICNEFRIEYPAGNESIKVFVDCINDYLLEAHAKGRHTVLIIDEAQNLSPNVLEQMRLLTNLETNQRKLLQIILLGQPELASMLERPEMQQLAQRIVARYHLGPLTRSEVAAYVRHRLEVSGAQRQLIPAALVRRLYRLSKGIPRVINVLCDRALLGAYVQGKDRVDRATLAQAAREVFHQPTRTRSMLRPLSAALLLVAGGALALTMYQQERTENKVAPPPAPKKAAKPPPPLPRVPQLSAEVPGTSNKAVAYAALFRAWGADYQGGDPCRQAAALGLRCRSGRGGLDDLREWNRPAMLQMNNHEGHEFYATLTALTNKTATFAFGTQTREVALGALATQWSGTYTLLWRAPPEARQSIQLGERGPVVEWLSRQLAQAQGKQADANEDPVFDGAMQQQVKQFQLVQGLTPDGIVGPQTLVRLSNVADQSAPKLLREQGGK